MKTPLVLLSLVSLINGFQMKYVTNPRIGSKLTRASEASFLTPHNNNVKSSIFTTTCQLQMVKSDVDEDVDSSSLSTPLDKPLLATIDAVALVIFSALGKASHSADGSLDILGIMVTAFPFLLSWFATSPITGVYKDEEESGIVEAGKLAAKGWIVAVPLGCALRGVIKGYVPPAPFVIVTMIVTLVMLAGSRILYTVVDEKFSNSE